MIVLKVLLLDNYDSFTYMLKDYIVQCGVECVVKRNDEQVLITEYDALIISPGPKTPEKSGSLMEIIAKCYQVKPILGICLGHQALGEFFGAKLVKAILPKHGKAETIYHTNHPIFKNIPTKFTATRYHSLIITEMKDPLTVIARSGQKEIMAFSHTHLPIYGIQFHPESCMTDQGITMLKNFLQLAKQLA